MVKIFKVEDVAQILKVTVRTVERWIHSGKLIGFTLGSSLQHREWRIRQDDLEEFVDSLIGRPQIIEDIKMRKTDMRKTLSTKVLERAFSDREIEMIMEKYANSLQRAGSGGLWDPTKQDWARYNQNRKLTIKEWAEYWDCNTQTVFRKLGKMYFKEE